MKAQVKPESTSNQSSKPCTVLQYPSKKVLRTRSIFVYLYVCMYACMYVRVIHFVYVFEARVPLRKNHNESQWFLRMNHNDSYEKRPIQKHQHICFVRIIVNDHHDSSALQPFCVCTYVGEYVRVIRFVYVFEARVPLRNNHNESQWFLWKETYTKAPTFVRIMYV